MEAGQAGGGIDFWAALGVGKGIEEKKEPRNSPVSPEQDADTPTSAGRTATESETARPEKQDEWNSLFSPSFSTAGNSADKAVARRSPAVTRQDAIPLVALPWGTRTQEAQAAPPPAAPESAGTGQRAPQAPKSDATPASAPLIEGPQIPQPPRTDPETADAARPSSTADGQVPAAPAWIAAEHIARSLQPRMPEIWLEMLRRHTNGDEAMASRVYNVLSGAHLLGELWRDQEIDEVHIQGTMVTVCGARGMYQVPGFPSLASAQRAIETAKSWPATMGATVTSIGDGSAVVVSRRPVAGPDVTTLLAGEVMTKEQLAAAKQAIEHMQAVTVTGPAARVIVRALASLVPSGSRVYLAAYGSLPAGCVAAAEPMEADYVIGVRPGGTAEHMAATGQIGAIIANPEKQIPAAVRFTVSGQSAKPGKLTQIR